MNRTDNTDVWGLVEIGDFESAIEAADEEFKKTGNIFPLRNKVYALLNLKRYTDCVDLTSELIRIRNGETQSDFVFCGVAYWLTGQYEKAIEIWRDGKDTKFTDAAGGIEIQAMLYFGAVVTSNQKLISTTKNHITKLLRERNAINWPAPIGSFLCDRMSVNELMSKVSDVPILKERQQCQMHFVISVKNLEAGNFGEYAKGLRRSVSYGRLAYLEAMYYLAKGVLEKMQP
jgi:tetratricopeptide (TPR) repeat protein